MPIPKTTAQANKLIESKYSEIIKSNDLFISDMEKRLALIYGETFKDIERQLTKIFDKLPTKDLFDKLKAGEALNLSELNRLKRLNDLQNSIIKELNALYKKAGLDIKNGITSVYQNSYYGQNYAVSSALGLGFDVIELSKAKINAIINNPLDQIKWSERLRRNLSATTEQLRTELGKGLVLGENPRKVARRLSERMDIGINQANRIARTEMHRAQGVGSRDEFLELQPQASEVGFEMKEVFRAVLDNRTRAQSASMDGQIADENGLFTYPNGELARPETVTTAAYAVNDRDFVVSNVSEWVESLRDGSGIEAPQYNKFNKWAKENGLTENIYKQKYEL